MKTKLLIALAVGLFAVASYAASPTLGTVVGNALSIVERTRDTVFEYLNAAPAVTLDTLRQEYGPELLVTNGVNGEMYIFGTLLTNGRTAAFVVTDGKPCVWSGTTETQTITKLHPWTRSATRP